MCGHNNRDFWFSAIVGGNRPHRTRSCAVLGPVFHSLAGNRNDVFVRQKGGWDKVRGKDKGHDLKSRHTHRRSLATASRMFPSPSHSISQFPALFPGAWQMHYWLWISAMKSVQLNRCETRNDFATTIVCLFVRAICDRTKVPLKYLNLLS